MNVSATSHARSLSKTKRPLAKQTSRLLDGASIGKQLQSSSVGKFHAALYDLKQFLPMVTFQLPRVIVLGTKSAGKSSLLENITKCAIFPRSLALCTKMPLRLQLTQVASEAECNVSIIWQGNSKTLQSKDDILAEVSSIMDTVDTVLADELVVQICQVRTPFIRTPCNDQSTAALCLMHCLHARFCATCQAYLLSHSVLPSCVCSCSTPTLL